MTTALAIGLVLAAWLVMPLPLAVLVGRSLRAESRSPRGSDGRARPTYSGPMKVGS